MNPTPVPVTIRRALPAQSDAETLLAVERRSLGDSPYTAEEALAVLRRREHHAYLALAAGEPRGFLSCLETPTDDGPRLELDMLGVVPEQRGRGIATALLRTAMEEAEARGVRRFRGAVAEDNLASRRAFERAGLCSGPTPHHLTVYELLGNSPVPYLPEGWSAEVVEEGRVAAPAEPLTSLGADGEGREVLALRDAEGRIVSLAEAVAVHTLSYRGLWLERYWSASPPALLVAARGLVERAKALDLDEVGYLAPPTGAARRTDDALAFVRAGYRVTGRYYVYTREP